MPRVIHFEINADKPERAVKFYKNVFGWDIQNWEEPTEYWLATTGKDTEPGINGAIMPRLNKETTINTIGVASVDEYAEKIKKAGGKIVQAKTVIPGIGYFAYCQDTEGNLFGIMQPDPKAH